jgi:hypothetical protein
MDKKFRKFNGGQAVDFSSNTTFEINIQPSNAQLKWLRRGLDQAGGKLPLFDGNGQKVSSRTINSCIKQGWAEPWFNNPIKPDWLVCKLTKAGRKVSTK